MHKQKPNYQTNMTIVAELVSQQLGLSYIVEPMDSVRYLGDCDSFRRRIRVNRKLLEGEDRFQVRETTLHEIAHALAPDRGHGPGWRAMAVRLGCDPTAGARMSGLDLMADARYLISCSECGWSEKRGAYQRRWRCSGCHSKLEVFDVLQRRRII